MTSVEAAASLFGSEDESSDPFASLGGEASPQIHNEGLSFGDGDTAFNIGNENTPVDAHIQVNSVDYSTSPGQVSGIVEQPGWYNGEAHSQSYEGHHTNGPIGACITISPMKKLQSTST
jgi:hypothetical protein